MKFVIFGSGGTGGVIGGYLAQAGNDVTFIARGEHLAAMQKNGLTIHTNHRGDLHIEAPKACRAEDYTGIPDIIFVCVKYYSLDSAIDFIRRVGSRDTLIIPILNVFGTGGVMQQELPGFTVLDGCIYVFAKRSAPGIIAQPQKILRVFYGFRRGQKMRPEEKAAAQNLEPILRAADIHAHYSSDIERDALTKFSFVSPMGAVGLYYDCKSDDFKREGEIRNAFIAMVSEVKNLGEKMGVTFDRDLIKENLRLMDAFAPGLTTSMQRDVAAGGSSEFSGLVERISLLGKELAVPVPTYDKITAWGKEHHLC